jgi:hypothetical protein
LTNAERAIVAVVVWTAIMAAIYLVRRAQAGDLDLRRDVVWVAGLAAIGAGIAALFAGPEAFVILATPVILVLGGAYLARNKDRRTQSLGWLTVAVGTFSAILALIRLFALG